MNKALMLQSEHWTEGETPRLLSGGKQSHRPLVNGGWALSKEGSTRGMWYKKKARGVGFSVVEADRLARRRYATSHSKGAKGSK